MKQNIAPNWIKRALSEQATQHNGAIDYFSRKLAHKSDQLFKVNILAWPDIGSIFLIPQDSNYRDYHWTLTREIRKGDFQRDRSKVNYSKAYKIGQECYFLNADDVQEIGTWLRGCVTHQNRFSSLYTVKSLDYGFYCVRSFAQLRAPDLMFRSHGAWALECKLAGLEHAKANHVSLWRHLDLWIRQRQLGKHQPVSFYIMFKDFTDLTSRPEVILFYKRDLPRRADELVTPRPNRAVHECLNAYLVQESGHSENSSFNENEATLRLTDILTKLPLGTIHKPMAKTIPLKQNNNWIENLMNGNGVK